VSVRIYSMVFANTIIPKSWQFRQTSSRDLLATTKLDNGIVEDPNGNLVAVIPEANRWETQEPKCHPPGERNVELRIPIARKPGSDGSRFGWVRPKHRHYA
jgi:hypothetical protein